MIFFFLFIFKARRRHLVLFPHALVSDQTTFKILKFISLLGFYFKKRSCRDDVWCQLLMVNKWTFQLSSAQSPSCVWLCDPIDCSKSGFPVHHQLPKLSQTNVHRVDDAISKFLLWRDKELRNIHSPDTIISSSVTPFSSCLQSLPASGSFQMISSLHQEAKVLEFQLQHQSFQWMSRTDLL